MFQRYDIMDAWVYFFYFYLLFEKCISGEKMIESFSDVEILDIKDLGRDMLWRQCFSHWNDEAIYRASILVNKQGTNR